MNPGAWALLLSLVFLTGTLTTAFAFVLFHFGSIKKVVGEWQVVIGPSLVAGIVITCLFWLLMRNKT